MKVKTLIRIIGFLFLFFIGFVILSANFGWDFFFFDWVKYLPLRDKMAHFLLVGGVSFFVNLLLDVKKTKLGGKEVLLGSLVVFIFITLEEFSQLFIIRRNFELIDLSANYLGIFLFGQLALFICNKFHFLEKRVF
ncbi:MAG: VanZ family protein [Saprospiraceae bacterium]